MADLDARQPMRTTFQRALSKNLKAYLALAEEVEQFCEDNDLSRTVVFKVRLVLEELVLNLIDHATNSLTDRLDVRIEIDRGRVVVVVEDDGDPFDPRLVPAFQKEKPLEERGPRGMGIHLVRSMSERISYERIDCRNRVEVVIRSAEAPT